MPFRVLAAICGRIRAGGGAPTAVFGPNGLSGYPGTSELRKSVSATAARSALHLAAATTVSCNPAVIQRGVFFR
jgi:hypothetical protein